MTFEQAPVDLSDRLAILGYGEDALAAALRVQVQDALDSSAVTVLVQRLLELQQALQSGHDRASTPGIGLFGLFGRLFGQDVELQAHAQALRARLGVILGNAEQAAAKLAAHVGTLPTLQRALDAAIANIGQHVDVAYAWLQTNPDVGASAQAYDTLSARQQLLRRLRQLQTAQASWELSRQQLQLLQVQQSELLARWQRIRDVLVPAWRQQAMAATAAAASSVVSQAGSGALDAISAEVSAITGKLAVSRHPS